MTATRLTDLLREEHEVIERALDALEAMIGVAACGDAVPASAVRDFTGFCRSYADGLHHQKEEELLFPALQRAGLPRDAGPIGCMLREHDMGRGLVGRLVDVAGHLSPPSPAALAEFSRTGRMYNDLLRAHIQKENGVLFVMAEHVLGDDENVRLVRGLRLDETRARRDRDLATVAALAREWTRPRADPVPRSIPSDYAGVLPSAMSARTAS